MEAKVNPLADEDRYSFRMLARTRKGKVMWFDVFPESKRCGVIDAPHTGLQYVKDPLSPVLQCTGLRDSKGTPIYEGDILKVQYRPSDPFDIAEVFWDERNGRWKARFYTMSNLEFGGESWHDEYSTVIGNIYIAPVSFYSELAKEFPYMEVDDTGLRTVIYTGVKRPDEDEIVLYLERDYDKDKLYLTDLGETAMFIASCGVEPEFEEVRKEVNEENVVKQAKKMIEEIRERFGKKIGHIKFGGKP
jgi:hypothetical protein